ncbi:hypothetical protein [Novosphingobium sp.]|uniref:hypothetical protein n=1 Tax=Novosphingobium sp. TaxID=1874826 RepID=UPI0028AC819A|nr:hypothetical protein [Novosphingobium sp.]
MSSKLHRLVANLAGVALAMHAVPVLAQGAAGGVTGGNVTGQEDGPTFADIADLSESAGLVVKAQIRKMARVEDERAPGLAPGMARFYVNAQTLALIAGKAPIGESFAYLVDLPLDAKGKAPKLKKQDVLLFARAVPGRPGELQLVTPTAQQLWSEQAEARVRGILKTLLSGDAPVKITGVRELMYVPGNLAGQGETQIFLNTKDGSAASITVRHEPGAPPAWGVSFSELVADIGNPPRPETVAWYRLACFLPNNPPPGTNVAEGVEQRRQAASDYRMVIGELGECRRTLNQGAKTAG